VPPAG